MFHGKENISLKGKNPRFLRLAVDLYPVPSCNILSVLTSLLSLGAIFSSVHQQSEDCLLLLWYKYSLFSIPNTIYCNAYIHEYGC